MDMAAWQLVARDQAARYDPQFWPSVQHDHQFCREDVVPKEAHPISHHYGPLQNALDSLRTGDGTVNRFDRHLRALAALSAASVDLIEVLVNDLDGDRNRTTDHDQLHWVHAGCGVVAARIAAEAAKTAAIAVRVERHARDLDLLHEEQAEAELDAADDVIRQGDWEEGQMRDRLLGSAHWVPADTWGIA